MRDWVIRWWRRRKRQRDLAVMWPRLKREHQNDVYLARGEFCLRIARCPAWRELAMPERRQIVETLQ